jgi:hypothetical protein
VQRGSFVVRYCIYQTCAFGKQQSSHHLTSILSRGMEGRESELALGIYLSSMKDELAADLDEIVLYR